MNPLKLLLILSFCLITSACSFVPRSKNAFPDELNRIHFSPSKPDSALSTQLNALFRSMDVKVVKNNAPAPFSIVVTNDNFSYGRPDIVDSTLPTTISFSQSAHIAIENSKGAMVAEQPFITTQTITINANQIYTSDANELVRQALNQQMVTLIYYWLISFNTKAALHNAVVNQTIKHAS